MANDQLNGFEPQPDTMGYPSRVADLDARPGFRQPPAGYGEVPFWWWTGDDLDADRMIVQVQELHKKRVSGVQVNYSHFDTPGWMTDQDAPEIFSEAWWVVYSRISETCASLNMGIGMSTYTIDWPRGAKNLFYHLFYHKPEWNALQLEVGRKVRLSGGEQLALDVDADQVAATAYPVRYEKMQCGGIDLSVFIRDGRLTWTAPTGTWEVWTYRAVRQPGSFNPLLAGAGEIIIDGLFQQFENRNPGGSSKGLNYFFNDELQVGVGKFAWNTDFAAIFKQMKGYDLLPYLPAMWTDMGDITPKVRMDYADVRMYLMEARYFKPIYDWHASRGLIFACDSGGRGTNPAEFGDYFRATRWYSAPGHDTPGGKADLIKGKVSSSIANLYQRPRVWLEGYHSLGWGAAPERLMFATRENYLYGCTLLNLHGLYYSTYGSYWEWAPPCYHFRMPYWAHMDVFLGYFERLSYLMSQGRMVCDVAVVYPVAPFEAEMDGNAAKETAFDLAQQLMVAGINFEFIDNDSLAQAVVRDGRLVVESAGASYQALVVPNMQAVRWPTIVKAAAFADAGGKVYAVGALPSVSDRAGRNDTQIEAMNAHAFKPDCRLPDCASTVAVIAAAFVQDVRGIDLTVRALHRKVGPKDVYMVMDAPSGSVVEFRAKGAAELWDPWAGSIRPLQVVRETVTGTQVLLPLESYEAQIVVFTPGQPHINPPCADERPLREMVLPDQWTVSFESTMDNRYGDFRLPVTDENKMIGVEARRFATALETAENAGVAMLPDTDDRTWTTQLHDFGPKFYVLGPVPEAVETAELDAILALLTAVDPSVPIRIGDTSLIWSHYEFSWRYGKEGDPGHQGYHGLKRIITDDFMCLGKSVGGLNETRYAQEDGGSRYYLWTTAVVPEAVSATIMVSRASPADHSHTSPVISPAAIFINGNRIDDPDQPVPLQPGATPVLIRYDNAGRGHFVLRRTDRPAPENRAPLAMRWHQDEGVIPFDVQAGKQPAEWFRFLSAPGTTAIRVQARGTVQAWLDGQPMNAAGDGRFTASKPSRSAAVVALRIIPEAGCTGASAIPEPIQVETSGDGILALGDWSVCGILNNYSGGVRYRTTVTLDGDRHQGKVIIDLGAVVATAEVHVNGRKAGVRVAPPWRLDISGLLIAGENRIEVLVYNTLANHYQTIPSKYKGSPVSGLMGPVRLLS